MKKKKASRPTTLSFSDFAHGVLCYCTIEKSRFCGLTFLVHDSSQMNVNNAVWDHLSMHMQNLKIPAKKYLYQPAFFYFMPQYTKPHQFVDYDF